MVVTMKEKMNVWPPSNLALVPFLSLFEFHLWHWCLSFACGSIVSVGFLWDSICGVSLGYLWGIFGVSLGIFCFCGVCVGYLWGLSFVYCLLFELCTDLYHIHKSVIESCGQGRFRGR